MTNLDRTFRYFPLELPTLGFDDPLTDMVVELEKLRDRVLVGTTHPLVFSQIKDMFHLMESVGSARIEGNNTTVAEYIETKIEKPSLSPMRYKTVTLPPAMAKFWVVRSMHPTK